jgi:hypothetical protein
MPDLPAAPKDVSILRLGDGIVRSVEVVLSVVAAPSVSGVYMAFCVIFLTLTPAILWSVFCNYVISLHLAFLFACILGLLSKLQYVLM